MSSHLSVEAWEAVEQLRRSGFSDADSQLDGSLLDPIDPDWVTALFEHTAGRREHPGEPGNR